MTDLVFLSRAGAIDRMNLLGRAKRPFFFLIDFDGNRSVVEEPGDISPESLQYVFPKFSNASDMVTDTNRISDMMDRTVGNHDENDKVPMKPLRQKDRELKDIIWNPMPQSFDMYQHSFDIVHHNIHLGNSFLTNLTCATTVETNLSLFDVFQHAHARYKLWVKDQFVVFSPEIFVRIENGMIYSHPMKGTADATQEGSAEKLLADEKEMAEHATITDLIRNDLSQVASEVTVTRYRYLEKLQTNHGPLWQMSSEIRGRLPKDFCQHLGDLFFQLLPAGSITGAPKKKTVEIIREAENYERGFYTGVMGYFDGTNLDSAVLIRFIQQMDDGTFVFKSGGGITFKSIAINEYNEMMEKVYVPIY